MKLWTDTQRRQRLRTCLPVISLVIAITVVWLLTYRKWSASSWEYPPSLYRGDALYELGIIRAASFGWYLPGVWKIVPTLGAPNGANWNDYPQTEDCLYAFLGGIAALLGLMPAANLALLLAFVLNGLAFYWAARLLRYQILWSYVGALLFACSHYAYARSFGHLELSYYGHLPLALVSIWWLSSGAVRTFTERRAVIILAVAAWTGLQNAYYTYLIAQLILLALLVNCARARRDPGQLSSAALGVLSLAILGMAFVFGNIDSLSYKWCYGSNPGAIVRSYRETELYALKPIELFLPTNAAWPVPGRIGQRYAREAYFVGETFAPYLGVIATLSLIGLVSVAFVRIARRSGVGLGVPRGTYQLVWILLLSVAGGINSMVAIFGFHLFRAANRYSIAILTIALLFFVRWTALWTRRWPFYGQMGLALVIVAIGLADQVAPKDFTGSRAKVDSDRSFCAILRRTLPRGSAIFQLPVAEYPEQGPIGKMGDYDHLRPFLFTTSLRFSCGDDKGRRSIDWAQKIEAMPGPTAVDALRGKGFAGIIIDRDGYADQGVALVNQFKRGGATVLAEADNADLIALKLP